MEEDSEKYFGSYVFSFLKIDFRAKILLHVDTFS